MLCGLDSPVTSIQNAASWGYFNTVDKTWNTERWVQTRDTSIQLTEPGIQKGEYKLGILQYNRQNLEHRKVSANWGLFNTVNKTWNTERWVQTGDSSIQSTKPGIQNGEYKLGILQYSWQNLEYRKVSTNWEYFNTVEKTWNTEGEYKLGIL